MSKAARDDGKGFQVFRAADALSLSEAGCMAVEPFDPATLAAVSQLREAGYGGGGQVRVLVNIPGFSLTHVWFKSGYPLPLHSHDADCLYYVVAGSLQLGTQALGPRDSFFVPCDAAYTYQVGPDGVELLEFRHANAFNFVNRAKNPAFWSKAIEAVKANRDAWRTEKMPALNT